MKRTLVCFCLCVSMAACAPATLSSTPAIHVGLTETPTELPVFTTIPNTSSPIVEMSPSPVTTSTANPNQLTYENAAGQEVTVELGVHEHTNKNGAVIALVQPPDKRACIKYFADHLPWYSVTGDVLPLLQDLGYGPDDLKALLKQFDIDFPPKDHHTGVSAYPSETSSLPFMVIFITGLDGGTLAAGRQQDGLLISAFCDAPPDQFKKETLTTYDGTSDLKIYLEELAGQHQ